MAIGIAAALMATACGGGSDASVTDDFIDLTQESTTSANSSDAESGAQPETAAEPVGPITGLVTAQPSFESALWIVDPATGEGFEMPITGADRVNVQDQPITVGDKMFTLGVTEREGQSFSNDISLVRIDRSAGTATAIAELGFDLENDDSSDRIDYELLAATSTQVLVEIGMFGEDGTIHVFDATTGAEIGSFAEPFFEFQSDTSSCSGNINNVTGLTDGTFMGTAVGSAATLDPATGLVDPLIPCDADEPNLADMLDVTDPAQAAPFLVSRDGVAPSDEDIAWLLDMDLEPDHGFIEGVGDLWWINAENRKFDTTWAIATAVVRFDPTTATVSQVYSLGEVAGSFGECEDDGSSCELNQLNQADLAFVGGQLVIVDSNENSSVLVLDPATGSVTETLIDLGDGVDYTNVEILAHGTSQVWLEIDRMTITKDDESGRTASGPTYFETFDPASAAITASVAGEDLFF